MPNQGLSETGQIIAAIATAIILALLAKFGLTPNDESPQDDGGKGKGNIVINFNANGVAEREAAQGKEDTRPIDEPAPPPRPQPSPTPRPPAPSPRPPDPTPRPPAPSPRPPDPTPRPPAPSPRPPDPPPYVSPIRPQPSPAPSPKPPTPPPLALKRWDDLRVGSLPFQNRKQDIRADMLSYRREGTICLTIIVNSNYAQDMRIAVWGEGPGFRKHSPYGNDWAEMDISRVGLSESQVYWVAHLPMTTEKLVVLCRTDDARYAVEPQDAWQYCQSARLVKKSGVRYIMTSKDDLNTYSNFGYQRDLMRLSDMTEDDARSLTPAIYIPKRNEVHVTPEKKKDE
jgi:hypothetical protein